jgi:hypothetical protein
VKSSQKEISKRSQGDSGSMDAFQLKCQIQYLDEKIPNVNQINAKSSNEASTVKGSKVSETKQDHNKEEEAKSEHSEYAVLIPEHMEIKEPVIDAEVRVHHRSTSKNLNGMFIEGKRRSVTPIDETRNN